MKQNDEDNETKGKSKTENTRKKKEQVGIVLQVD